MFEQVLILRKNIINKHSEKDFTFRSYSGTEDLSFLDFYSEDTIYKEKSSVR